MSILRFEGVRKEYSDGTVALNGVSFAVEDSEFVFVNGRSGAGKTTLLKLILREELPTEGTLYFEGTEIPQLRGRAVSALRKDFGVVFQDFKLIPSWTILENICLPLEIRGEDGAGEKALEMLELVDLANRAYLFPRNLSGGEKQRAAFARALIHKPRVLLADEPTGNIDPESSQKIRGILEDVNKAGTTVLVATHDLGMISALKKRVIRLDKGELSEEDAEDKN